jgi:hypothetical protein
MVWCCGGGQQSSSPPASPSSSAAKPSARAAAYQAPAASPAPPARSGAPETLRKASQDAAATPATAESASDASLQGVPPWQRDQKEQITTRSQGLAQGSTTENAASKTMAGTNLAEILRLNLSEVQWGQARCWGRSGRQHRLSGSSTALIDVLRDSCCAGEAGAAEAGLPQPHAHHCAQ